MGFTIALSNVLIMLFYLVPGYILRKMNKALPEHLPTLSSILVYIGTPFLEISAYMNLEFSWTDLKNLGLFMLVSFFSMTLFMLVMFLFLHKKFSISKYRILTIGSVMGNVGYFGLPIIRALFPENPEVACYSAAYMVSMNILVFTLGVYCITSDKKYISVKSAICNPTVLGFLLALPFYLFGIRNYLPSVLINAIQTVANMTTPLCMFILGIRLASAPLKAIFSKPIVYVTSLFKLLIYPLFAYGLVVLLPFPATFKASLLIISSAPCASVILSLAEMHRKETEISADCILVSTLLCFITIPLLTLLVL